MKSVTVSDAAANRMLTGGEYMGNEFVEQLIRMEAEQSAQQTYGVDYCELSPDRRYLLRRQAIEELELGSRTFVNVGAAVHIDAA